MSKSVRYALLPVMLFIASSCGKSFQKVTRSSDPEFKFTKANEYYEKGDCSKAIPLYEELIPVYKGTKSIDDIYYKYADCHFSQGDYLIASFHFKNIYDSYTSSEFAEESLFMHAYSYYMLSPDVQLDQTYTEKALEAFQLFVNAYPYSSKMQECNTFMDNLWKKLETKAFRSASLYLKTGNYRAAATAFTNIMKDFPDSEFSEESSFLKVKAYFLFAQKSVADKQYERYALALEAYKDFIYRYKDSKFAKEAEQLVAGQAMYRAGLLMKAQDYKGAAAAYKKIISDFPDTKYAEEAGFNMIEAYYLDGIHSEGSRQLDGFNNAITAFSDFASRNEDSKYFKNATRIHKLCLSRIEELQKPNL